MIQNLKEQGSFIKQNFPSIKVEPIKGDNLIIYCKSSEIIDLLSFLKNDKDLSFKTLVDLFAADMLGVREPRFEVIYVLLSYKLNNRITVKVSLNEQEKINTAVKVYPAANWLEREIFDMYGIGFKDHPDLRRILSDYSFEGHPLRKDFPLTGYKQVKYDYKTKEVVYEPLDLTQEFRQFDFESPWEGDKLKR